MIFQRVKLCGRTDIEISAMPLLDYFIFNCSTSNQSEPSDSGGCGGGEESCLTCSTGFQRASSRRDRCARGAFLASSGTWRDADAGGDDQLAGSYGDGGEIDVPPLGEDEQQGALGAGDPVRHLHPLRGPPPPPQPPPPILPRHCSYCCCDCGRA